MDKIFYNTCRTQWSQRLKFEGLKDCLDNFEKYENLCTRILLVRFVDNKVNRLDFIEDIIGDFVSSTWLPSMHAMYQLISYFGYHNHLDSKKRSHSVSWLLSSVFLWVQNNRVHRARDLDDSKSLYSIHQFTFSLTLQKHQTTDLLKVFSLKMAIGFDRMIMCSLFEWRLTFYKMIDFGKW